MGRLLIVEDEEIARVLYKRLLTQMGHRFEMAANLDEARRYIAASEGYDLLVTDMRLPDGRGTDILGGFHERFPAAKVLIVTGSPDMSPEKGRAPIPMPVEWLYKPFELEEFSAAIGRLLA